MVYTHRVYAEDMNATECKNCMQSLCVLLIVTELP